MVALYERGSELEDIVDFAVRPNLGGEAHGLCMVDQVGSSYVVVFAHYVYYEILFHTVGSRMRSRIPLRKRSIVGKRGVVELLYYDKAAVRAERGRPCGFYCLALHHSSYHARAVAQP